MPKNYYYLLLQLIIMSLLTACSDDYEPEIYYVGNVKMHIAEFSGNRKATLVLSFDDGTWEQFAHAVPALESRGLTGTFFTNAFQVRDVEVPESNIPAKSTLKSMVEKGFEVSNHTYHHVNLTKIPMDSVRKEIQMCDDAIEEWTGVRPVTFSFPNNARNKNLIKIAMQGRVGVREEETGFGQTYRSTKYKDLIEWVDKAVKKHNFEVAMFHGIEDGYDHWKRPEDWTRFLDYLVASQDEVWIPTFRDACKYIKERDNTVLDITESSVGMLVKATTNLDPQLYDYPLTIVVNRFGSSECVEILPNQTILIPYHSAMP